MEEYDLSYADNKAIRHSWANSFRNMNFRSANVSPKVSARNSYAGDSLEASFDYHDVFGGPPKSVSLKQKACRSPGLTSSDFSLPTFEIPVFGEKMPTRRRFVNDEFYDDIFNGHTVSNAGERSDICSVSSRSGSRKLSPVHPPLSRKSEHKSFSSTNSPLAPKPRPSNTSKASEYPIFGISGRRAHDKCSNNVSNISSVQSSPHTHSLDPQETPLGRFYKSKMKFPYGKEGLKNDDTFGGFPRRSPNLRSLSFLEPGESLSSPLRESSARESIDEMHSDPQNTSCSITSEDDRGGNIPRRMNLRISKSVVKGNYSELAEEAANGLEKARLSTHDMQLMTRQERSVVSSPSHAFHEQQKLNCWQEWRSEPKGNGSPPVVSWGSSGASSFRGNNVGASIAQEAAQLGPGLRSLDTHGIDSGEESDEFGSFVIEIDSERRETFAFVPEKDIQVDSSSNLLDTPVKETMSWAKQKSQSWRENKGMDKVNMPAEGVSHDKFRGIKDPKKCAAEGNHYAIKDAEASMQSDRVSGKGRAFIERFAGAMPTEDQLICRKLDVEQRILSAAVRSAPVDDQEKPIKDGNKVVHRDGYLMNTSLGVPAVVKEVSDKVERWRCDRPFVICRQTLEGSENNDRLETYLDEASTRETPESWRKRLEVERQIKTNDRVAKSLVERKLNELQAEQEQLEKSKVSEALDSEIKRWSAGKEGNIRALLSTLQYVLWAESGWRPVPLIEIIEGAAVKKAYQKARLCVHPDKLQQKGATAQQKYIAEKVFDILQAAWAIFSSMDPF